jgi:hypothetical protein
VKSKRAATYPKQKRTLGALNIGELVVNVVVFVALGGIVGVCAVWDSCLGACVHTQVNRTSPASWRSLKMLCCPDLSPTTTTTTTAAAYIGHLTDFFGLL